MEAPNYTPYQPQADERRGFFRTYFIDNFLGKYADFSGLSTVRNYWLTMLAYLGVAMGLCGVALLIAICFPNPMKAINWTMLLVGVIFYVPVWAIFARRLRDANMPVALVGLPILSAIIGIVYLFLYSGAHTFSIGQIVLGLVSFLVGIACLIFTLLPSKHPEAPVLHSKFNLGDGLILAACFLLMMMGYVGLVIRIIAMVQNGENFLV